MIDIKTLEHNIVESSNITIVPTEKLNNEELGIVVNYLLQQLPGLNLLQAIQIVACSFDIINCMDLIQFNGSEIRIFSEDESEEWAVTVDLVELSEFN